jgi:signal transduction histidine kinase
VDARFEKQGANLQIRVIDNGIGMSIDQMDKLFDTSTLYTTRGTANEKGTGLGLRLCKEFVERMGGNIWVESVEGTGSTFKFTINRA